jgi:hypothetical protein
MKTTWEQAVLYAKQSRRQTRMQHGGCIAGSGTDDIVFAGSGTIQLTAALPNISTSMNITNAGANNLIVRRDAGGNYGIFLVNIGTTVNITGLTVTNGNNSTSGGGIFNGGTLTITNSHITENVTENFGGGIKNSGSGTLNLINSTVSSNISNGNGGGGGIDNNGALTIVNSTVSGNKASNGDFNAGGVWCGDSAATITNSTISNNEAAGGASSAGGVLADSGIVTTRNSIIAANRTNAVTPDVKVLTGSFTSSGYNLIGSAFTEIGFTNGVNNDQVGTASSPINPQIEALALNGGQTPTHTLLPNSPAIDKGNSFGPTTDQRGLKRPIDFPKVANAQSGDGADIGAFELQLGATAAGVSVSGRVLSSRGAGVSNTVVILINQKGEVQTTRTDATGYYIFEEITAGETYIFNVYAKRYQFNTQLITVIEDLAELNFTAQKLNTGK